MLEKKFERFRNLPRPVKFFGKECIVVANIFFKAIDSFSAAGGPRVVLNSVPKAGTNLMLEYFKSSDQFYRPSFHVDSMSRAFKLFPGARNGQLITGHLTYSKDLVDSLIDEGNILLFIYRDPRALIVSAANYIIHHDRSHRLHQYGSSRGVKRFCNDLIDGRSNHDGPKILSLAEQLLSYKGWLYDDRVCCVAYEDIIGADSLVTQESLRALWQHITMDEERAAYLVSRTELPKTSRTMRRGTVDSWREVFDEGMEARLAEKLGGSLELWMARRKL